MFHLIKLHTQETKMFCYLNLFVCYECSYIESKSEHWNPSPTVILKDMDNLERLKFAVWLSHKMNHQDMGEKWSRRAHLLEEMVKIFRDLDIQYRLYPIEINVRNMPMVNSERMPPGWTPGT